MSNVTRWSVYSLGFLFSVVTLLLGSRPLQAELTGAGWTDGHGHIEFHYEPIDPMQPLGPKHFDLHWHIGQGTGSTVVGFPPILSQDFEADEIHPVVPLVSNSNFARPSGANWDFTGTTVGTNLYVLPLSVPPDIEVLPRLGLASSLTPSEWVGGNLSLTFSLIGPAPGHFSIFDGDSTIPVPLFSSFGGAPASFNHAVADHVHHNYAFTAPGVYEIELTASGTHVTNGMATGTSRFQFFVGDVSAIPEPSSAALLGLVALVGAARRRR